MEKVAEIVSFQKKNFDGFGVPSIARRGEEIPLGARILKVALGFDSLEAAGHSKAKALEELKSRRGSYDSLILEALEVVVGVEAKDVLHSATVTVMDLQENWILAEDVKTVKGLLLVTKGQETTRVLLERLKRFVSLAGIQEPFKVIIPQK